MSRVFIRLSLAASLFACASSGTGAAMAGSRDYITSAEITSSGAMTALDLTNRLRPNWLRAPATGSLRRCARNQVIVVYLDGHRLETLQAFGLWASRGITSLQWLDATRAETVLTEVGSDPIAGAIIIKTH